MPCFPYSRQSDAPYKRNGMPRRIQPRDVAQAPLTRHLIEQTEERKEAKLSHLKDGASSPLRSIAITSGSQQQQQPKPIFSIGPSSVITKTGSEIPIISTTSSSSSSLESSPHTNGKVSRLEISSIMGQDERNTLIASPMQPSLSSLGLTKTGYKHWVARSGTLVANIVMAAGNIYLIFL